MLSEGFVSSLLQAGITGAGLVFAIYALVATLYRPILDRRAQDLREKIEEYEVRTKVHLPEGHKKQQLEQLEADIRLTNVFPWYFGIGIGITFLLYMVSVFSASVWLANVEIRTGQTEFAIWESFICANVAFLAVGLMIILQISRTLKKAFADAKKEVGRSSREP